MLEVLVYPVSAVMKAWHWLLADIFTAPTNTAWVATVTLLVLTVRGMIAPFAWQTYKTARATFLMRPHLHEVKEQYGTAVTPEALRAEDEARKKIHKEYGYNPFAACVPALIQVPVFLGLYRLLFWMAVPGTAAGQNIGILGAEEIAGFRAATLADVPLPAYVAMTPEQFAFLGTSLASVRSLAIPLIIAAIVFTSLNLLISQLRNRSTLEWEHTVSRRAYYLMYWAIPIVAVALGVAGLTGLVPIALLLYWVVNNLFTFTQTALFWFLIVRRYPADELHRSFQADALAEAIRRRRQATARKRSLRTKRLEALSHPTSMREVRRAVRGQKQAWKDEQAQRKAAAKELAKQRSAARKILQRERAAERVAARKFARRNGGSHTAAGEKRG